MDTKYIALLVTMEVYFYGDCYSKGIGKYKEGVGG